MTTIKEKWICMCGHELDIRLGKLSHKKRQPPAHGGKRCMDCNCHNPSLIEQIDEQNKLSDSK